jgi:Sigma-54 interaction domain
VDAVHPWRTIRRCEGILRDDPDLVPALLKLAEAARLAGQDELAEWTYADVLERAPDCYEARRQLAALHDAPSWAGDGAPPPVPPLDQVLIGDSAEMRAARAFLVEAARGQAHVLLLAERGEGRRLFARCLHERSVGFDQLSVVDCEQRPAAAEEALFGLAQGRDGTEIVAGLLETHDTILLLGVESLSSAAQDKLQLAVATGFFLRGGGFTPIPVTARVVAAATQPGLRQALTARTCTPALPGCFGSQVCVLPSLEERADPDEPAAPTPASSQSAPMIRHSRPRRTSCTVRRADPRPCAARPPVRIAVVGPAGAGKTTLLTACARLLGGRVSSLRLEAGRVSTCSVPVEGARQVGGRQAFELRILRPLIEGEALEDPSGGLRQLLEGAATVIFVARSGAAWMADNLDALRALEDALSERDSAPRVVFAWNERDVDGALPPAQLRAALCGDQAPAHELVATQGHGVEAVLHAALRPQEPRPSAELEPAASLPQPQVLAPGEPRALPSLERRSRVLEWARWPAAALALVGVTQLAVYLARVWVG